MIALFLRSGKMVAIFTDTRWRGYGSKAEISAYTWTSINSEQIAGIGSQFDGVNSRITVNAQSDSAICFGRSHQPVVLWRSFRSADIRMIAYHLLSQRLKGIRMVKQQ